MPINRGGLLAEWDLRIGKIHLPPLSPIIVHKQRRIDGRYVRSFDELPQLLYSQGFIPIEELWAKRFEGGRRGRLISMPTKSRLTGIRDRSCPIHQADRGGVGEGASRRAEAVS